MRRAALLLRLILLVLVACQRTPAGEEAGVPGEASITPPRSGEAGASGAPAVERELGVVTTGRFVLDDEHVAHVFSPLDGRVVAVSVRVGQRVKKGDPLASVDAPEIRRALSDTRKAQADLTAAEHDYQRQKQFFEMGEPRRDMEAAYDQMRGARAELERARAKARLLGPEAAKGEPYVLRAPIDGEVLARNVDAGAATAPRGGGNPPVPLFIVGDHAQLWALADVLERDLPRVHAGQEVTARIADHPDRAFAGRVDWVSTTPDPETHLGKVRCAFPNPTGELAPEMQAVLAMAASAGP